MAKQYGYYLEGNKVAIVEKDTSFDNNVASKEFGPGVARQSWKSPLTAVSDGLEIKYAYSPEYFIEETNDISTTIGNYMSDDGYLVVTTRTVTLTAFANGTDGDASDVTVTCANHGFSNGDSVIVSGTTNYNGTYTIDQVATDTFDIEVSFNAGETAGSSTTLATLNINYGSLSGYNITDGSYIVLKGADKFNGLHKTITKDAHNGVTNGKIKLETRYSGSTSLSSVFSSSASLYYNLNVLNDEADLIDLPPYLTKALIYYVKAKLAEDAGNFEVKQYMEREFRRMVEKYENTRISVARMISSGSHAIR